MDSFDSADAQAASAVQVLGQQLAGDDFSVVQTHLSRLLLLPDRVLKFKRPVQLPFADFSTLQARQHFCQEELRLNQRLAPELYVDVLPIGGSPQAPQLGQEPAWDWAVQMRRFDCQQELRQLVQNHDVSLAQMQAFGAQLADFYRQAPQAPADAPWGTSAQVEQAIGQVLATLSEVAPPAWAADVQALQQWWQQQAPRLRPLWQQRHAAGHIREGHGDLHLGNVVRYQDKITAFDCIEFEPAFRWLDPMADVGFLTMDLKLHGRADLAWGFLDSYLTESGDYSGLAVLQTYEVYRAMVRAMVAAFAGQTDSQPNYCAGALALAQPLQPRLLITHGLSGAGKSTVALALLQAAGAVRLRSDVERKRLAGLAPLQHSSAQGLQLYTPEMNARTQAHLLAQAQTLLQAGFPVVVDGAFLQQSQRQAFADLAHSLGLPYRILHCSAAQATLHQRITQRQAQGDDPSEADTQVLAQQQGLIQALTPSELAHTLNCNTDAPWDAHALAAHWLSTSFD